jgi:hypothetical protein
MAAKVPAISNYKIMTYFNYDKTKCERGDKLKMDRREPRHRRNVKLDFALRIHGMTYLYKHNHSRHEKRWKITTNQSQDF